MIKEDDMDKKRYQKPTVMALSGRAASGLMPQACVVGNTAAPYACSPGGDALPGALDCVGGTLPGGANPGNCYDGLDAGRDCVPGTGVTGFSNCTSGPNPRPPT